jgi:hypothetical protein
MLCPPVLFIVFNRPETTAQVFSRIKEARPGQLFIAADGPRLHHIDDKTLCRQVRSIVNDVDWPCEIHTLFRDKNVGCKMGVLGAINWFFEHVEQGIILEDDCLPAPDFFIYCYELLNRYKGNPKILSINGYNFGYRPVSLTSYFFTRYMNMWGWATWRRSAQKIDYQLDEWGRKNKKLFLYTRLRTTVFDFDWKWVKRWRKTFDELTQKNVDTWDYYWIYAGLKHRLYSIVPHRNLIQNIGFNESATHTHDSRHPITKIDVSSLDFPLLHPRTVVRDIVYEEECVKKVWHSYFRKNFVYQLWAFYRDVLRPECEE